MIPIDQPRPGFYRRRLVKGGPFVAVRIFVPCPLDPWTGEPLDRPRVLSATVAGEPADPWRTWTYCAAEPISAQEFRYLERLREIPGTPESRPRTPIDLGTMPPVYTRRKAAT